MKKRLYIVFLGLFLLLFAAVYMIRKPHLENNVSSTSQAHIFMLTTQELWQTNGAFHYHAAAVQSWDKEGDSYMHYYQRLEDKEGNNYYVSHPPFAFQLAGIVFFLTQQAANQSILQHLLFFLLLLGALLLAWIVKKELKCKQLGVASFFAAVVYVFVPVNLFAHSFHYFSETVGQFFMIASIASLVYYKHSSKTLLAQILVFMSIFLLSYTDWMGIPFVMSIWIVYHKRRKQKNIKRLRWISLIAAILAYSLSVVQYASIAGFNAFYRALGIRFLERSGFFGPKYTDMQMDISNSETWIAMLQQIHQLLIGPGYFVLLLCAIVLFIKSKKRKKKNYSIALIAFLPAFIYSILLFSATATHYVYMAKFTPFLALALAFLFAQVKHTWKRKYLAYSFSIILLALLSWVGITDFKTHVRTQTDTVLNNKSADINRFSSNKDAVFLVPFTHYPASSIIYLSYESKRSLCFAQTYKDASAKAKENNKKAFVLLDLGL
jgi:hypothetical protein